MVKQLSIVLLAIILLAAVFIVPNPDALAGDISSKNYVIKYTVQRGDTLSEIAYMFGVPLAELMKENNLKTTTIHPRQVLIIPDEVDATLARGSGAREGLMLLARAIYAEARGETFTGQVAVGAVILNRVAHKSFPGTIREVIMQRNSRVAQFTPVADGSINLEPDQKAIRAAMEALRGNDPTRGALFFYNPRISNDRWITTLPVVTKIGNHVFATET